MCAASVKEASLLDACAFRVLNTLVDKFSWPTAVALTINRAVMPASTPSKDVLERLLSNLPPLLATPAKPKVFSQPNDTRSLSLSAECGGFVRKSALAR